LLDTKRNRLFAYSETARSIWDLIESGRSVENVVDFRGNRVTSWGKNLAGQSNYGTTRRGLPQSVGQNAGLIVYSTLDDGVRLVEDVVVA